MSNFLKVFAFALLCLFTFGIQAQDRLPAFEMNGKLGRGINMGNSFEAPTETAWGNPWKPEYFRIIAELGFHHVRLPVRWEPVERSMAGPPYTINASFLERIKAVVDTAIKYDLYIIVNMHHHDALFEDPEGEKERFLSQWNQIADYFRDYPDNLLFEVLNEPHGNISPEMWNQYFAEALTEIRKTNPTRVVLMGVAEFGGLGGIPKLELPNDEYIILSPHYYNPFTFTHQGAEWVGTQADEWLGTEWFDTEAERETVENEFRYALQFSEEQNIPIHVGEFGAYSKADIESRERWTTFLARWFEEQGLSWAYWEFSAGFGIYDPATKELLTPLVDALLNNEMPEPTPVFAAPLYSSNFSSGKDGWSFNVQGGASGSISASGGKLQVNITSGGTEAWHAQLVRNNIPLEQDKMYRISFKASAAEDRSTAYYLGKASDPWNSYSGNSSVTLTPVEESFASFFTMTSPSDPQARLVFDLGTSTVNVTISEVKVEELSFEENETVTALSDKRKRADIQFYPNPAGSRLFIHSSGNYTLQIFDVNGRRMAETKIDNSAETVDLSLLKSGIYTLCFSGKNGNEFHKLVKK